MFHVGETKTPLGSKWAIWGLAILSLTALIFTAWILTDFQREQEILKEITKHLPASDLAEARELAGELQLQIRLSALLILNLIASGVALTMLARAYITSERSLREVKVMATDILASMDQGVITTDRDARILSINPRGFEILDPNKVKIGMALADLTDQHKTLDRICGEVLETFHAVRDRDYVATQAGHVRTFRTGCSLLRDDKERLLGTVIHVRDVTEKALMEQRLRRMERYMGLGSLAAGLQHEIKNPLSALSLHVQLLSEALADQGASVEVREILNVLNTEVRRITGVLEGFRDFASVSQLCQSNVDFRNLVEKLVRLIEPQALQQHVRIETRFAEDLPETVRADSGRMEQVLLNLMVNALNAMPDGGILTIRLNSSPDFVTMDVCDTGCGIPEDLRERIFDPYFTTRNTGTGMGLALSDKIVRQHDGTIELNTGPEGTVFSVSLPRNET
ncbi:MAG: ATP-binding protein [Planctomycetaceae bacterium]